MDRLLMRAHIISGVLSLAAIILSVIAIVRINKLHLTLPLSLAVLNFIIPLVALPAVPISRRLPKMSFTPILTALAAASIHIPFTTLVLAFVYGIPSDLLTCSNESRWRRMFRMKDPAIRAIQDQLRCCGFNSLRDQAWPFPSRDIDAGACARTLHYTIRCADVWLREEVHTAAMVGIASFLNWVLLVYILNSTRANVLIPGRSLGSGSQQRLLGDEPEQRGIANETYEDEPARQRQD